MMADDPGNAKNRDRAQFVARAEDVFGRDVLQPLVQHAGEAPGDVRHLIAEFRSKLDALDVVVATIPGGSSNGVGAVTRAAPGAGYESPQPRSTHAADTTDDIGRNQRSRLRELTLLEFMSRETRAYSLQQLINALAVEGFGDTSGAIVSQLHRLKKMSVINQPANGMYEITDEGLSHLRHLRTSFGSLRTGHRAG